MAPRILKTNLLPWEIYKTPLPGKKSGRGTLLKFIYYSEKATKIWRYLVSYNFLEVWPIFVAFSEYMNFKGNNVSIPFYIEPKRFNVAMLL